MSLNRICSLYKGAYIIAKQHCHFHVGVCEELETFWALAVSILAM